jgi:hypothetical protein
MSTHPHSDARPSSTFSVSKTCLSALVQASSVPHCSLIETSPILSFTTLRSPNRSGHQQSAYSSTATDNVDLRMRQLDPPIPAHHKLPQLPQALQKRHHRLIEPPILQHPRHAELARPPQLVHRPVPSNLLDLGEAPDRNQAICFKGEGKLAGDGVEEEEGVAPGGVDLGPVDGVRGEAAEAEAVDRAEAVFLADAERVVCRAGLMSSARQQK